MWKFIFVAVTVAVTVRAGVPRTETRIVGGTDTTILQHPYIVSIRKLNEHTCGGSILDTRTVLTAAHCVYYPHLTAADFIIHAGSTYRLNDGEYRTVSELHVHPDYDDWTLEYDIAVLKVATGFAFGSTIQPIRLPSEDFKIEHGTLASVAGWGTLYYQGPSTNHLQHVLVPVVRNSQCGMAYQNFGTIWSFHLCAGGSGVDACQGDSGGPLVYDGQVIGIVSWGYGCAFNGYPTVYTRVTEFLDFIRGNL
ncbi:trypsin-3-like [Uranotaenia lowii]|uniref:trypsin-3-like n=1 Tax=Uranotaenia lowii TaxID=190385 RepID=UPI00247B2499|nr:trypsin-3-like [Uranotaenia lowii]